MGACPAHLPSLLWGGGLGGSLEGQGPSLAKGPDSEPSRLALTGGWLQGPGIWDPGTRLTLLKPPTLPGPPAPRMAGPGPGLRQEEGAGVGGAGPCSCSWGSGRLPEPLAQPMSRGPQEPARGQLLCLEVAAVFRGQIEEGNGRPKQPEGVPPGLADPLPGLTHCPDKTLFPSPSGAPMRLSLLPSLLPLSS